MRCARANEQAPVPESPELRIAALSAGEQEAYRQALQEANRLGAAQVDAGQAARAAAQVTHGDKPSEQDGNVEVRPEEPATAQPIAPATVVAAPPAKAVTPPPTPAPQDKPEPQRHAEQRDPPRREEEPQPQPYPNSEAPTENRTASQTPEPAGQMQAHPVESKRATPHAAAPLDAATQMMPTQRTEQAAEPEKMVPMPAVAPTQSRTWQFKRWNRCPSRSRCLRNLRAIRGLWSRKRHKPCQSPNRLHWMTTSPSPRLSRFLPSPR